jgi:hypothetical protein
MDDGSPPPCLKEIYDPPLITRVRGKPEVLTKPGIAMVGTRHPTPTVLAWPSCGHAIWPPKNWSLLLILMMSGLARGVATPRAIVAPSRPKSSKPRNIRHAHHRRLCARTKSRRVSGARQGHQQKFLGTEHAHPTGRGAGGDNFQPNYDLL